MNSTVQKLNSLVPVGSFFQGSTSNIGKAANTGLTSSLGLNSGANAGTSTGTWNTGFVWLLVFFILLFVIIVYFYNQFMEAIQNWMDALNLWYTGKGNPVDIYPDPRPVVNTSTTDDDTRKHPTGIESVVEKILPPAKDVFTVSKNDYTYYDAAPLCKALGAELATYDEVKHAWQKGADWCNYGWVKGQMAVYPTQKSSYEELQQGPPDQRGVCGKPGLNGGYFDNPELKFGVTCVGKKPSQSEHDATRVASGATRPLTASGIAFENRVQQFKEDSETIGVLPFNKEHWSS